jgi:tetratricopeptide (TPR) repeat protein
MPAETCHTYRAEPRRSSCSFAIGAEPAERSDEVSLTAECERQIDADSPNRSLVALWDLSGAETDGQCELLASLLHHDDPRVVDAAEQALWRLWFASGPTTVQSDLYRAMLHLQAERWPEALADLDAVLAVEPGYAEAWNQRAIAHYFAGDYCRSVCDCRRALMLNPYHFGAMAGMGHCFAQLGRFEDAMECYHRALQIHPRMEGVRQTIREIRMWTRPSRPAGC